MAQVPWHTNWVHAQRPFWQVLGRGRWGLEGLQGPGLPSPAQRAAWSPAESSQQLIPPSPPTAAPIGTRTHGGGRAPGQALECSGVRGGAGLSPGVAVDPDLVPGLVQVVVVHTWACLLHHAATPAIVHQPLGAHAATDALCLVLGGGWRVGFKDQMPGPGWPAPLLTLQTLTRVSHPTLRSLTPRPGPASRAPPSGSLWGWETSENGLPGAPPYRGPRAATPSRDERAAKPEHPRPRIRSLRATQEPPAPPASAAPPERTWPAASVWQLTGLGLRVASAVRLLQSTWIFGALQAAGRKGPLSPAEAGWGLGRAREQCGGREAAHEVAATYPGLSA